MIGKAVRSRQAGGQTADLLVDARERRQGRRRLPRSESATTNTARTGGHYPLTFAEGRRAAHSEQAGPHPGCREPAEINQPAR